MRKLIFGLVASLTLLPGNARADGTATPKAACCEGARPWTGFYVGVGAGSGAIVHDLTINVPGLGTLLGFDGIGGEGVFGTVVVGYDRKLGSNIVGGIFMDYDFSGLSTDLSIANGLLTVSLAHEHSWSVGGRLGVLTSPATLWYGLAGYTQAEFSFGALDMPKFKGYVVGGGVESQLHGGWALRAEYRLTQFDRESLFSVPGFIDLGIEPSMHTARLALTYKWAREEAMHAPMK